MNNEIDKLRDEVIKNEYKLFYWELYNKDANNFISKWYSKIKINKYQSKINKLNKKIDDVIGCC
jgi:hypothetical protein